MIVLESANAGTTQDASITKLTARPVHKLIVEGFSPKRRGTVWEIN
jgi:hypothetical protein